MSNNRIDILFKTITLLHRELLLEATQDDTSRGLAKTITSVFTTNSKNNQLMGGDSIVVNELIYLITDMSDNPDNYDADGLTQTLNVILKDREELLIAILKAINAEMGVPGLKRSVLSLRHRLNSFYKEYKLKTIISKTSYKINVGDTDGKSLIEFAQDLASEIEALTLTTNKTKDAAIVDEFDLEANEEVEKLFSKVSGENKSENLLSLSWDGVNDMLQGGIRRGAFVMVCALQHNYKSGFVRSMLAQIARTNTPVMTDPTKKPLLVYISFEDDAEISIEFLYSYLYYSEFNKLPDMTAVTPVEAAGFIKEKLSIKGYSVKMLRVDPSAWTYKHLFNKTMEYEADGYEVHSIVCDYLSKLPTTGCHDGPTGTALRDMFNRVRNHYSAKKITFITPHQLSTEAKQLLRGDVNPADLPKVVAGKGYLEGSKQLDQVVDIEIYLSKAKINSKWHLCVQRGKDRRPGIVDEDLLYTTLPFPDKAPIPEQASMPKAGASSDINIDDLF